MKEASDGAILLTPKNVYRYLTGKLPGIYSTGVLPAQALKGLTLTKFWTGILQGFLSEQLMCDLFDTESRSRSLSNLMNRTGASSTPARLLAELNASLNAAGILKLTGIFSEFLTANHYQPEDMARSLQAFEKACAQDDVLLVPTLQTILKEARGGENAAGGPSVLFCHALSLSWLTLLALYGDEMNCSELLGFCSAMHPCDRKLWPVYSHISYGRRVPRALTNRDCVLCRQPLPEGQYVQGDGTLLNTVTEKIRAGGKLLVRGMGGIGKTELVRQAMRRLEPEGLFSRVAYVQYNSSLADSFRAAFPSLSEVQGEDDDVIALARAQLEESFEGRTLLMIDSVNTPLSEDAHLLDLSAWGCDVVMTSRFPAGAEGFDEVAVPALTREASQELFLKKYTYPVDAPKELGDLLDSVQGHPLAISLLASLARIKRWSVTRLNAELHSQGFASISFSSTSLTPIISSMKALIDTGATDERSRRLLALFATFPYQTWSAEAVTAVLTDVGSAEDVIDLLQTAADYGYLDAEWSGYAMHPVLAECFRAYLPAMGELPSLIQLAESLYPRFFQEGWVDMDVYRLCISLLCALPEPTGEAIIPACWMLTRVYLPYGAIHQWLVSMRSKAEPVSPRRLVLECVLLRLMRVGANGGEDAQALTEQLRCIAAMKPVYAQTPSLWAAIFVIAIMYGVMSPEDQALADEIQRDADAVFPLALANVQYLSFRIRQRCVRGELDEAELEKEGDALLTLMHESCLRDSCLEAEVLEEIGNAWIMRGDAQHCLKLAQKALAVLHRHNGSAMRENYVTLLNTIALCYKALGQREEALQTIRQALSYDIDLLTKIHIQTNLASILVELDRVEEAAAVSSEVLRGYRALRVDTGDYAAALQSQAVIARKCGRPEEALALLEEARGIFERLGFTLYAYACDAVRIPALAVLNRRDEALALARQTKENYLKCTTEEYEGYRFVLRMIDKLEKGEKIE